MSMGSRVRHEVTTEQQQQIFNFPVKKIVKLPLLLILCPTYSMPFSCLVTFHLSWEIANRNEITAGCSDIMYCFDRKNREYISFFFIVHQFLKYNQGDAGKHFRLDFSKLLGTGIQIYTHSEASPQHLF